MKKTLIIGSVIIVFALIISLGYLWFSLDGIVKRGIEKYASQALTTKVTVSSVSIKPTKGTGSIRQLRVSNPANFSTAPIFSLHNIRLHLDIASITHKVIVINDVSINSPHIAFEVNQQGKTNILVLQQNIKAANANTAGEVQKNTATKTKATDNDKRFIIKKITISGTKVDATITPLKKHYTITIPAMVLTNLGAPQGATPKALASQIGIEITQQVLTAMGKSYSQQYLNAKLHDVQNQLGNKLANIIKKNI